jgi:hypothetical protein
MAAIELTSEGMLSPTSMPLGMSVCKTKIKVVSLLEPSVFTDDGMEGWTVVCRRRWSPAIGKRSPDPRKSVFSKFCGLGPARTRAGAHLNLARWGPNTAIHRVTAVTKIDRSDGDCRPYQVKVGDAVAGRAFRNLLGLAWKKFETGEPVVQRRRSVLPMNGDGRQGFNPGRGGFNTGRGG